MNHMTILATLALFVGCENPATPGPGTAPAPTAAPAASASGSIGGGLDPARVVATWDGGQLTAAELQDSLGSEVVQLEVDFLSKRYQTWSQGLDQMVMTKLVEAEAKDKGFADSDALLKAEVEDKITPPTDEEIESFYNVMKRQLRGQPLESVRPQVAAEVLRRKQSERFQEYIEGLRAAKGLKTDLPYPDLPRIPVSVDDDPFEGAENAPVTIVQFAEYQCPYCGRAGESVDQVMKAYEGKVKMVFRDFPLSFHNNAIPAAIAANCADKQGKYWEMHKSLMADQSSLDEADLVKRATDLQLNLDTWNVCRKDPAMLAEVQHDMEDGAKAGVSGTPAFFINGIMISGAQPFSQFKEIIDRELGKKG